MTKYILTQQKMTGIPSSSSPDYDMVINVIIISLLILIIVYIASRRRRDS